MARYLCASSSEAPGMLYSELAGTLHEVEQEPSRLGKEDLMSRLLERAWRESTDDLGLCVSLTSLQLRPSEPPLKLGMGDSLVLKALAEACDAPPDELKQELTRHGDLGDVAAARLEAAPEGAPLALGEVRAALLQLDAEAGKGSAGRKTELLAAVLQRASPLEARYLLRSIRGKVRTGLGDRSLRAALAQAGARLVPDPSEELREAVAAEAAAAAAAGEAATTAAVAAAAVDGAGSAEGSVLDAKARKAQEKEAAAL
eukprot:5324918-Prymnesium_polylepis.2